MKAALTRVRGLASAGNWSDAQTEVDAAIQQFPHARELAQERDRIRRASEAQEAVLEATRRMDRREFASAIAFAEAALNRFPADKRLAEMLEQARRQLEFETSVRAAETLLSSDRLDEGAAHVEELRKRAPEDPNVQRLAGIVERQQKRRAELEAAEQRRKRFEFAGAREILQRILKQDPDDDAAGALLRSVEYEAGEYARRQRIAGVCEEADRLLKGREYDRAVRVLEPIAEQYSDEEDLHEMLRRARNSRDEAYARTHSGKPARRLTALCGRVVLRTRSTACNG